MTARRVLVVDDSAFTCEAIAWALRSSGFEVQVARDLSDLEEKLITKPDLALVDVVLQEAFGDDLAPLLRATHDVTGPILLMSSLPEAELAQRARDAGLEGFVSKRGGLVAIVNRVAQMLGGTDTTPITVHELVDRFAVSAHQRLRRVTHVTAQASHWNAPAIESEMHALAGDADLVGATQVAEAARTCRDAAHELGSAGWSTEIAVAIEATAAAIGDDSEMIGRLLVIDATDYTRSTLLAALDWRGYVVIEARRVAEARQKLRAADYDVIVVDEHTVRGAPTLLPEIRAQLPAARIAVLSDDDGEIAGADAILAKSQGAARLLDELESLLTTKGRVT